MCGNVTTDEIREALTCINENKALGPNGYTAKIFKAAWSIMGKDVELLKSYGSKNGKSRCAFKIDIMKAYDTVNWDFLEAILRGFGFPWKPCVSDDIHSCLASRFRFSEVVKSSVSEPLVRGSFDVLVGIGRCPRGSFGIVCHERWLGYSCEVMRFGVHGLNVIKVEFRIDLVHGATSVAISLLRCLSTIGKCKKKKEHEVHLKLVLELLRNEKLYAKFTKSEAVKNLGSTYDTIRDMIILRIGMSMEWGGTKRAIQTLKKDLCDASVKSNSGVKDNILLQVRRPRLEKRTSRNAVDLDQQMEKEGSKANVVIEALSRKERVKPRRVRAMAVTIQYGVRDGSNGEAHASDAAESVRDTIGFEYCLASSSGWTK
ncbi:hypothetical protein Tco_1457038 [Tanacetum coccineum]